MSPAFDVIHVPPARRAMFMLAEDRGVITQVERREFWVLPDIPHESNPAEEFRS